MLILMLLFGRSSKAQLADSAATTWYVTKTIHSDILNEDRRIHIYTPAAMKNDEAYPVLYLLDGEAFISMAGGQVQYLSESYKIIPALIIVGIENTDRTRDLTPTYWNAGPDGRPDTSANAFGKNSGGGEKFLAFLQKELVPYIDSRYPVAPYKILAGHSLGGLMAVHSLVNHPGLFNAYIAISPSLQWDNEALLQQLAKKTDTVPLKKILFFSDAGEGAAFHQNLLKLDSILKQKNIPGLRFRYNYYPEETHISEPVKALYDGLRQVYPGWYLPYNSSAFRKTLTAKMITDQYAELSAMYDYKVIPPQYEISQAGKMLRNDPKRINDAIELLRMNTMNYPASTAAHELLGDTYLKNGDTKNALNSFRKALILNPANENIRQKIRQLEN